MELERKKKNVFRNRFAFRKFFFSFKIRVRSVWLYITTHRWRLPDGIRGQHDSVIEKNYTVRRSYTGLRRCRRRA